MKVNTDEVMYWGLLVLWAIQGAAILFLLFCIGKARGWI